MPVVRFGERSFRLHLSEVTTGPPLYLVSACSSAEEFVAAFRRYADRTGLFVPSVQPLPAGRRGRLAITLKDGGVMIEGDAEILQSSAKPTVLHGRPGMTVKFVDPDEPSKVVIGELEKARLAMKPAPPSVPPRPADIPAEPRAVPPAPGGRIDAANALAECVVIGDVSSLEVTAGPPKSPLGDSKFVVPSIPAVGAPRPKSPSTPPELKPPAPPSDRAKTPTAPPNPASTALPAPPAGSLPKSPAVQSRMTSIGFPAIDKLPAKSESGNVPAIAPKGDSGRVAAPAPSSGSGRVAAPAPSPGSGRVAAPAPTTGSGRVVSNATTLGMPAIDRKPDAKPAPASPLAASQAAFESKLGAAPGRGDATPPRFFHTATVPGTAPAAAAPPPVSADEEATAIGTAPPKKPTDPPMPAASPSGNGLRDDEATAIGDVPVKKTTDPMPTTAPIAAAPSNGPRADAKVDKKTSIGFPVVRSPFETQPLGLVPPAPAAASASGATPAPDAPADPSPPTLPKTPRPAPPQGPRTKSPTAPPGRVRVATPASPLPVVRMPAKPAPVFGAEDEKTDLGQAPTVSAVPVDPIVAPGSGGVPKQAEGRIAARSGGMRASEIMAAIPSGDWTMSPDESVPHVLPPEAKVTAPPAEPTPAPGPPPGPPTGDFIIALDPETGWGEPEKLAKNPAGSATALPAAGRAPSPASGNPIHAVASDKPISVVQWDEKPTGIGESKIEIDSTLMEPHRAMPNLDATAPQAAIPGEPPRTPTGESRPLDAVPPPLAPMPARPTSGFAMAGAQFPPQRPSVTDIVGYPPVASGTVAAKKKKMIVLAVVAGLVAVGAIVMLVLTLGGKKASSPAAEPGSGSAPSKVVVPAKATPPEPPPVEMPAKGSATPPAGSGSQQAAVEPKGSAQETPPAPEQGSAAAPPPAPTGPCKVQVVTSPLGADIFVGDQKLGTSPASIELPCGSESKIALKKKSFPNTLRAFTPDASKANKLVVKLNRTMLSVKVTSTPAGATITAGGKTMGVTPTTIKLPAGETSTITLTKPGFAADTQKVTPRNNSSSHHVTLKKGKR
jgi:hypothetical protein